MREQVVLQEEEGDQVMAKDTQDAANLQGPRIPWAGKQVDIQQVEDHLSHLWRMSADNMRMSQNTNVRTSVLNLVVCVPTIEAARDASTLLRDLSSTHIARVVLLILNENAPDMVATWVTVRSFPVISDLTRHNFEQITVMLQGSAVSSINSIVSPLLKPDLPVYLWWLRDMPNEHHLFEGLTALSTHLIVDSDSFSQPEESMSILASLINTTTNSALSDLNWGRITRWRELIAQFFDSQEYLPYLNGLERIEIEHSVAPASSVQATKPNPTSALLLAAWLKLRLGWRIPVASSENENDSDTGTHTWSLDRPTGTLGGRGRKASATNTSYGHIYIRPRVQPHIPPGSLCMVRLISNLDNKSAVFSINREDDDPQHVVTSVELAQGTRPQRTVSMAATRKASDLLHDELEIISHDEQYEQALQEVSDLLSENE
jgi:glucose-6-phosphate dehydrogenase assembly protein OpcA